MTTYTHNPMAGRCGRLLALKDDTPYCVTLREHWDGYSEEKKEDEYYQHHVVPQMCDDNDMCTCHGRANGVVWSQVMGGMPDTGEEYWEVYLTPIDEEDRILEERDERNYVANEARWRERIMTQDVSLSSGETYTR